MKPTEKKAGKETTLVDMWLGTHSLDQAMPDAIDPSSLSSMSQLIPICLRFKKQVRHGEPRWLSGLVLPSAQGLILETWDQVPHQAACMETASPSACVSASLSLSLSLK